jgi:type III restriction enzyme
MTQSTFAKDEKPDELVLKQFRKSNFDWTKYANFLEEFCTDREYLKEAIKAAVNLFLGNQYKNSQDLAEENWDQNEKIRQYHKSKQDFLSQFEFPDKLCCTLDLATGTGKSWAMYGVAQIMLCEGIVDRVLVLVPSTTIEKQLKEKFLDFSSNGRLKKTLPKDSKNKNPRIISADMTIMPGDICIENDDAILEHVTSSSILPSLKGNGKKTLIINDEAHHLISDDKNDPKWNQFIRNNDFGFFYILNSTGTPYKGNFGNNYFRDVVYRYSIRKAIDQCFIKDIKYLTEDEGKGRDKLSLVYAVHEDNKRRYPEIKKPLTIFVSGRIADAEEYAKQFEKFLIKKGISQEIAQKKILVVSSRHKENNEKLDKVDTSESPVEFIFSVSKLSEGWDVKNVFQIVPHEERAFNSKLLISQVLGRGLRIPLPYLENKEKQPIVTINNHDSWSKNIASYVDAVIEMDRLASYPIKKKPDYNFDVYWADSSKEVKDTSVSKVEKGSISLPKEFKFQTQSTAKTGKFREVKEGREEYLSYGIELNAQRVGDVAIQIYTKLKDFDKVNITSYSKKLSIEQIKEMLKKALKEIGAEDLSLISDENRQRALNSFSTLFREETKTSIVDVVYKKPIKKNTSEIQKTYVSTRSMDNNRAIVYENKSVEASEKEDKEAIIKFDKDYSRPNGSVIRIEKDSEYKCPLNIVHINHKNELGFVKRLIDKNNSKNYDCFVKVPDTGFYEIEYSFRPGSHSLTRTFNPDFIIKKGNTYIVVEIKSEDDTKDINVAKNKYAERYFKLMNDYLPEKQEYVFTFLSPDDFTAFFEALQNGKHKAFVSGLQANLREKQK